MSLKTIKNHRGIASVCHASCENNPGYDNLNYFSSSLDDFLLFPVEKTELELKCNAGKGEGNRLRNRN